METAIVIRKRAISSRPQWALIIHSINGYCVCVVDRAIEIVEGQVLYRHALQNRAWILSGSESLFPANITGGMSLNEAEETLNYIAAL
ncbi:hypothetical protein I5380_07515 [Citrobacter koseri]|uniref:hypothetical protein n=1 Tax=Citrobacter koseri TaxID=545 RepID=UPI00190601D5|nr:hypothetical protein [Citrobacter koseri]MBJ8805545.1 hypothetical protein [Citrobacter koseri]